MCLFSIGCLTFKEQFYTLQQENRDFTLSIIYCTSRSSSCYLKLLTVIATVIAEL